MNKWTTVSGRLSLITVPCILVSHLRVNKSILVDQARITDMLHSNVTFYYAASQFIFMYKEHSETEKKFSQ